MATHGKKYNAAKARVADRPYEVAEALALVKDIHPAKYDETVELAFSLGVNPKHADQMVRGTVVLPAGIGRTKRVCVFATGEKLKEAEEAGADVVGGEDLVAKVAEGFTDFDACVATPDMMRHVGKLGKVLGPRGLMPNPKTGTVTFEVKTAVQEIKAGKVEFRVDKTAIVHAPIGKVSFELDKLEQNALALIGAVVKAKPSAAKGKYIKAAYVSSTHGPGVKLDPSGFERMA